jgi:hypothetical protein
VQVDLGRSEDYGLYYFNVEATGENEVEVVVVEDVVGPLDTPSTGQSVSDINYKNSYSVFCFHSEFWIVNMYMIFI